MKKSPLKQGLGGLKGLLAAARQKEVLSPLVTLLLEKLEKVCRITKTFYCAVALLSCDIIRFAPRLYLSKGDLRVSEESSSFYPKAPKGRLSIEARLSRRFRV